MRFGGDAIMKITSIKLPEIMSYYFSSDAIETIRNSLLSADVAIHEDYIEFLTSYKPDVFYLLNVFMEKSAKQEDEIFSYKYEFDIYMPGGHIFAISTSSNQIYAAIMSHLESRKNVNIYMKFKILKIKESPVE